MSLRIDLRASWSIGVFWGRNSRCPNMIMGNRIPPGPPSIFAASRPPAEGLARCLRPFSRGPRQRLRQQIRDRSHTGPLGAVHETDRAAEQLVETQSQWAVSSFSAIETQSQLGLSVYFTVHHRFAHALRSAFGLPPLAGASMHTAGASLAHRWCIAGRAPRASAEHRTSIGGASLEHRPSIAGVCLWMMEDDGG